MLNCHLKVIPLLCLPRHFVAITNEATPHLRSSLRPFEVVNTAPNAKGLASTPGAHATPLLVHYLGQRVRALLSQLQTVMYNNHPHLFLIS